MTFPIKSFYLIVLLVLIIPKSIFSQNSKSLQINELWEEVLFNISSTPENYPLAYEQTQQIKQLAIQANLIVHEFDAETYGIFCLFELNRIEEGKERLDKMHTSVEEKLKTDTSSINDIMSSIHFLFGKYFYDYHSDYASAYYHYKAFTNLIEAKANPSFQPESAYNNLGLIYQKLGDYPRAMNNYLPFLDTSDTWGTAVSCNNIAISGLAIKDYPTAFQYLKQAEKYINQLEIAGSAKSIYANISNNFAEYFIETKALQNAHKYLDNGLALATDENQVLINFQHRALAYIQAKDYISAKQYLDKARQGYTQDQVMPNRIGAVFQLYGKYYQAQNQPMEALQYYQKAIGAFAQDFTDTSDIYANPTKAIFGKEIDLLEVLKEKAVLLAQIDELALALETYQLADQLLDTIRIQNLSTTSSKYFWVGEAKQIYENGIALADQLGEKEQAFHFCQKSHALILWESVQNITAKDLGNIPDSLIEKERTLNIYIAAESLNLTKKGANYDSKKLFKYKERLRDLRQEMEQDYPLYHQLKYELPLTDLSTIQEALASDEVLVEYFIGATQIYTFVITSTDFKIYSKKKPTDFLTNLHAFRKSTSKYNSTKLGFDSYTQSAYSLYKTLLEEVVHDFPKEHIIIIPDEELGYLNFGLLLSELPKSSDLRYDKLPYLIKQHYYSYNYSSALFFELNNRKQRKANVFSLVGFAPIFPGSPFSIRQGEQMDSLVHTIPEVESIEEIVGGKIYKGKTATSDNFKNSNKQYKIGHFATHATCDDINPENSKIHFTDTSISSNEIYNLDLGYELVVLSACKTGGGKLQKGEGILGLTRAFLSAGVPSVITSLWNVNDEKTAKLMKMLYENLNGKQQKHVALGNAQRAYLAQEKASFTHPFYWGAFVPIGNMQPVFENDYTLYWRVLGGVGLLLVLFFMRRNR